MGGAWPLGPILLLIAGVCSQDPTPTSDPVGQSSANLLQNLQIKASDALPAFAGGKQVLFKDGATRQGFQCTGSTETLAEEPSIIDFRRLHFYMEEDSSMSSMFGNILGDAQSSSPPSEVFLTEALVSVIGPDNATAPLLLSAALDRQETSDVLGIAQGDQLRDEVTVLYDCWQPGSARIELKFHFAPAPDRDATHEVCVAWRKHCPVASKAFEALEVHHGASMIYPLPDATSQQPQLLSEQGTYEEVTKLQLLSSGARRLKFPQVSSEERLQVQIRGLATDTLEVTASEDVEISIVYNCLGTGIFDVDLALERAFFSENHVPEVMHLHLRKHCGDSVYRFLNVFLRQHVKQQDNRTQAVSKGETLPGFAHCMQTDQPGAVVPERCASSVSAFRAEHKVQRTILELRLDAEGAQQPVPVLQPPPDLSFDRKILRAWIMKAGADEYSPGHVKGVKPIVSSPTLSRVNGANLVVRYTCHKAGVSSIVVTIYLAQHKPIDLAWQKVCSEPKIHISRALTAPQAMTFAFLVCGGIGMVVCMVCLFCSSKQDKTQLFQGGSVRKTGRPGGREIEFWHAEPDSEKVGHEYEEEVIYHPAACTCPAHLEEQSSLVGAYARGFHMKDLPR